jgi:hypothetical protein
VTTADVTRHAHSIAYCGYAGVQAKKAGPRILQQPLAVHQEHSLYSCTAAALTLSPVLAFLCLDVAHKAVALQGYTDSKPAAAETLQVSSTQSQ